MQSFATLVSRAKHPSKSPMTWRSHFERMPFVQHVKEVGLENQTWQEELGRQPPFRKTAQSQILPVCSFSRYRRLETTKWLCFTYGPAF